MGSKFYRLLRWFLIVILAVMPLRAALASSSFCHMSKDKINSSKMAHSLTGKLRPHHAPVYDAKRALMPSAHTMGKMANTTTKAHQCCCCDGDDCNLSQCNMGFHLTLLFQTIAFTPFFVASSQSEATNPPPVSREIHPPFRPPLKLA